jgi:hypothetical protein
MKIKQAINNYGKALENPIILSGIESAYDYLENIVTEEGYHILFHRAGSLKHRSKIIDRYQILTCHDKLDEFFVDVYNESNIFIPPNGYLFENQNDFFDKQIEEKYLCKDNWPREQAEFLEYAKNLPFLEKFISRSYGTTMRSNKFPFEIIKEMIENGEITETDNVYQKIEKHIKSLKLPK